MFKDFDVNIIDKYLKEKFPIVFNFDFDGLLLLHGSTIPNLMMGKKESRDLDFTLLTFSEGNIQEFIDKYKIEVVRKLKNGYRLKYKGTQIDIKVEPDLNLPGSLNTDRLFYDIKRKILIPIGIKHAIEKNEIVEYTYNGFFRPRQRMKNAKIFLTFLNHKKHHKVKYKYNRIHCLIKSFINNPQKIFKKYRRPWENTNDK